MPEIIREYEFEDALLVHFFADRFSATIDADRADIDNLNNILSRQEDEGIADEEVKRLIIETAETIKARREDQFHCYAILSHLSEEHQPQTSLRGFVKTYKRALYYIESAYLTICRDTGRRMSLDNLARLLKDTEDSSSVLLNIGSFFKRYLQEGVTERKLTAVKRYSALCATKIGKYTYQHNIMCHEGYYHALRTLYEVLDYEQNTVLYSDKHTDIACLENYIQRAQAKGTSKLKSVINDYDYFNSDSKSCIEVEGF